MVRTNRAASEICRVWVVLEAEAETWRWVGLLRVQWGRYRVGKESVGLGNGSIEEEEEGFMREAS